MHKKYIAPKLTQSLALAASLALASCGGDTSTSATTQETAKNSGKYPTLKQEQVEDTYFGISVKDPYRWLENPDAPEVKAFVRQQNELTFAYLDTISYLNNIEARLKALWNYSRYSAPRKEAGHYFYYKNDGLQNQSVLYKQKSLRAAPEVFIDPNSFSRDATVALSGLAFSKDGKYAAFATSEAGSDWKTIQVKEVESGKMLEDKVKEVKFSGIAWYKDGFFYSRYAGALEEGSNKEKLAEKVEFHQVYYHKIGTPQTDDKIVFADRAHPKRNFYASVTEDERYLILSASEGTSGNALYFRKLNGSVEGEFYPIVEHFDHNYSVVDNQGDDLLIRTNRDAPNYQVVRVGVKNPAKPQWKKLLPETKAVLASAQVIGQKLIVNYIKDVKSQVKAFSLQGKLLGELPLPGIGNVASITGKKNEKEAFMTYVTFTRPATIYQVDFDKMDRKTFQESKLTYNPEDFETKQLSYTSKDGTPVNLFVTHKKGIELNGENPTLLYGYGGFNISVLPRFSMEKVAFMEQGGVYAVANIRGGGEYGEAWHEAGTKMNKQNVFDDFIAAAEFLIKEKYTNAQHLAIEGRSNGGLLIGACMTQRPDLFQVALPIVGVLDMLRYHKFTIGWAWASDYGTSEDSKAQFEYLRGYSPIHNVKKADYPATLVMTADHDDRVVPAHSYKFIAELQANHTGTRPTLIRIDERAGHGAGKPVDKTIDEAADKLAFIFHNLGVSYQTPQ